MRVLLSQRQLSSNPIEPLELIVMTKTNPNSMKSLALLIGALVFTFLLAEKTYNSVISSLDILFYFFH